MRPENNPNRTGVMMTGEPPSRVPIPACAVALGLSLIMLIAASTAQGAQLRKSGQAGIADEQGAVEQSDESSSQSGDTGESGESSPTDASGESAPGSESQSGQSQQTDSPDQAGSSDIPDRSGDTGTANTLDKRKSAIPTLVREQQQEYQRLRDQVWNAPHPPAALPQPTHAPQARDSGIASVGIEARNVHFYIDNQIGYHVNRLKGELVPVNKGEPVNFDDPRQFRIHIFSGEVLIRPQDLEALMNNYILTYEPRSLSSVSMETSQDTLTVHTGARLFRFIPPISGLPTTLKGPVKVTEDNKLIYTPESVKQFGFMPVKPLLSALGLELSTLTPFKQKGIQLKGDQLIFDPETVFPPPRLKIDKVESAELTSRGLRLTFSSGTSNAGFAEPPVASDSYLWIQSGDALFSGVVLVNANLQVLNSGEGPLAFSLYDYRAQAAEGTIHSEPDGALVVHMPNDFEDDDDNPTQNTGLRPRGAGS